MAGKRNETAAQGANPEVEDKTAVSPDNSAELLAELERLKAENAAYK